MLERLRKYTIDKNSTVLMTLRVIDDNKKCFVIVIDEKEQVLSVLTDGDIRRALLNGKTLDDKNETIIKSNFMYLNINDNIFKCIELFKNTAVKFLPIIDNEKKLINIITREQLHSLLLHNMYVDLNYNFDTLDDFPIDYEIFGKPWGFYKTNVLNDFYQSKVLTILPLQKLSLQSHEHRDEYWVVVHGQGKIIIDNDTIDVKSGSYVAIKRGQKHRATNTSNSDNLIINEVQIGDYLGEDDIVRYEDEYGRNEE